MDAGLISKINIANSIETEKKTAMCLKFHNLGPKLLSIFGPNPARKARYN